MQEDQCNIISQMLKMLFEQEPRNPDDKQTTFIICEQLFLYFIHVYSYKATQGLHISAASSSLQVYRHKGHLLIYPDHYVVHSFEQSPDLSVLDQTLRQGYLVIHSSNKQKKFKFFPCLICTHNIVCIIITRTTEASINTSNKRASEPRRPVIIAYSKKVLSY